MKIPTGVSIVKPVARNTDNTKMGEKWTEKRENVQVWGFQSRSGNQKHTYFFMPRNSWNHAPVTVGRIFLGSYQELKLTCL